MISLNIVLLLLASHWFCDFVLQTDEQAKGKSTSNRMLFEHVHSYTAVFILILGLYTWFFGNLVNIHAVFQFGVITFIAHFITDYFTSRLNSKLWAKGDVHNFFVSIGFDQLLHFIQLLVTYKLLFI